MPPGGRFGLKAGSDVDAVAVEVVALDDKVAEVKADPEDQALRLWSVRLALGHGLLELDRGGQRLDGARESISAPSPVSLTSRPPRRASTARDARLRARRSRATVPLSSRPIRRE